MILNTLDHLGKFDAKGDEGYFVGYSLSSKAFRVFNKRTKKVEENLHVNFLKSKLIEKGAGPNWLFVIDTLTNSMNYVPMVVAGTSSTNISGTKDVARQAVKKDVSSLIYIALLNWFHEAHIETSNDTIRNSDAQDDSQEEQDCNADVPKSSGISNPTATLEVPSADQVEPVVSLTVESDILTVSSPIPTVCLDISFESSSGPRSFQKGLKNPRTSTVLSAMGELTFFLGLQVLQKKDGIFLSQDKYVGDILKKFGYSYGRLANTPIDKENPWGKDRPSKDVELHLYRSMIGSLMYLTASRPDIMFAVCACARQQVTPKECHLYAVKRMFRYLKDNDYSGATQDRKSTTRGCQFLGSRLISWQCKKQTIMATSTTKAEYVAAASGCGQVLWIQNQMLNYGRHLKLNDEEGISSLPYAEIFENLSLMGYNILPSQRRLTKRAIQIAQSKALSPDADKHASLLRDDRDEEAFPTVSSLDAGQDRENIAKTSAMSHESSPRVPSLDADEGNIWEELGADNSTEKGSNDTDEMVNVLSSMDAANILSSGGAAFSTASVSPVDVFPTVGVPTEQIDAQVAREMEEEFARENQRLSEQAARDSKIVRIHAEEKLKLMIEGLDRSNEVIAKHLSEYEQDEADLYVEEKIELIKQQFKSSKGVSEEELKGVMQLVPLEEVYIEALQVKHPIIDWEIHTEGKREYWKIVRLGETFSIKQCTRDKEKELWVKLKRLFKPDSEDQVWTYHQAFMHDPLDWKLYDTCGVHHVSTQKNQEIFMFVEKDYLLRKGLATVMIIQDEELFEASSLGGRGINEDKSDGEESRDEGADREMTSNAFSNTQSLDSRSCGNLVSKKEVQAGVEADLMSSLGDSSVKEGESLVDGGSKSNAPFSFNSVEKWPSLSETCGIEVYGVNDISGIKDEAMKEVLVGMKHVSFINVVQGVNKSGSSKLRLILVYMNDQGKRVVDMDPLIKKGSKNWSMILVGYFVGLKMTHKEILGHLRRMWRSYQLDELIMNDCGLYFHKFKSDEDGISRISNMIGSLIIMDRITTKMRDRSYEKASFVKVLIEVDADLGLYDKIEVWYKSLGRSMILRVEYPWKPPVCSHCKVFGHGLDRCLNRVLSDTKMKLKTDVNARRMVNINHGENSDDGWKIVNNRKYGKNKDTSGGMYRQRNYYRDGSSSRGGFKGMGRGGMNGRGFGDQRFTRNDGAHYVLVKKNRAAGPVSERETDKTEKGKLKVDEGKFPRDNGIDSGVVSERMNIDERVVSKGINKKKGSSKDINENLVWESMKERIDEACEKGLRISLEEKDDWTRDLWIYFKEKNARVG
nr:uncharacterized mitochondrial protein AtMg00810-like [Tanacetum cinerariifolium]